jgi:hypothetical protein
MDLSTNIETALNLAAEENAVTSAEQKKKLNNAENDLWKEVEKQVGPPVEGTLPPQTDIKIDPVAWDQRKLALDMMKNRSDATNHAAAITYLSFVERQEQLLLVLQDREKKLETLHKEKLTWQERVELQSQMGILNNQILQEQAKAENSRAAASSSTTLSGAAAEEAKLRRMEVKANAGLLTAP